MRYITASDSPKDGSVLYVLTNGWVLILGKTNGVIRRWGTNRGIGQLMEGPTESSIIDPLPADVEINTRAVLFSARVKW